MKALLNHRNIRNKFLYSLMLVAVISASLTSSVLIYQEAKDAQTYHKDKLSLMSSVITPSLTAAMIFNDAETINELIEPTIKSEGVLAATVFDKNNLVVASVSRKQFDENITEQHTPYKSKLMLEGVEHGELVFYTDYSVVDVKLGFYIKLVAQLLFVTLCLSLVFSLYFSRLITKSLSNLIDIANKVTSSKDYSLRAKLFARDEVGDLTECFNEMLDAVQHHNVLLESKVANRTKELEKANKKLFLQANKDTLSGLHNRRSLYNHLEQIIENESPFSLLFIDLDDFKKINDIYGHDCGDELLQHVSERILSCLKSDDFVSRLGGDEFMVILNDLTTSERINQISTNILNSLSMQFAIKNNMTNVSASIGIALFPEDGMDAHTLIKHADHAMYESKRLGKNCFQYFNQDMIERLNEKCNLVKDIHRAVDEQEFEVYYQPIVTLGTGQIRKAEALVRWNHPIKGILTPDTFLPTIEEERLMDGLGFWVATQATNDMSYWQHKLGFDLNISINVSPSQFEEDKCLLQNWLASLDEDMINNERIIIEITENSLMENNKNVQSIISKMRGMGLKIAVDDFGTGYSSLSYLQQFQLDILKIDRAFISNLTASDEDYRLCKGIIAIGKELGLTIIAEGIETEQQRQLLIKAGCEYGQGYLFAKPMPKTEFEQLVINNTNE